MSKELLEIERLLAENDISAGYLSANEDFSMPQLLVDFSLSGESEELAQKNDALTLQICHIPVPDSSVFILQFFVQLPMPPPFQPDAEVPAFLVGGLQKYIAHLNQVLPIIGFNSSQQDLYFRSSLVLEKYSEAQLLYYFELLIHLLQVCLPALQAVAIGLEDPDEAIANIQNIFTAQENDDA